MIDGRKLRAFREKRGITQDQVAKELGITKQTISQTEWTVNVGLPVAERYLNAILAVMGRRDRVTLEVTISVPMGRLGDVLDDLQEVIA